MPSLTGTVVAAGGPAAWAYVQVRSLASDFQGEVRTDADGRFLLHPMPGRWRLVAWAPGRGMPSRRSPSAPAGAEVRLQLTEQIEVRR